MGNKMIYDEYPKCVVEWIAKIQNRITRKIRFYKVYEICETGFCIFLKDRNGHVFKKFLKLIYKCVD